MSGSDDSEHGSSMLSRHIDDPAVKRFEASCGQIIVVQGPPKLHIYETHASSIGTFDTGSIMSGPDECGPDSLRRGSKMALNGKMCKIILLLGMSVAR